MRHDIRELNPRLAALLDELDANTAELARSNAEYREANDRFARFLQGSGVPLSVPPPPRRVR